MAAGLATLQVIESERLIEKSAQRGERLLRFFEEASRRHELIRSVRGKGLMIGIEFGPPRSARLRASWNLLETASSGLFCQLIVIPLFKDHKLLTQVAGHGNHTIKLLPPLVISGADCDWIERSFDAVIADAHRVPGAIWNLGKTLVDNAVRARATAWRHPFARDDRHESVLPAPRGGAQLMLAILIGAASLAAWIYLILGRGAFWRASAWEESDRSPQPAAWPHIIAVVPARNEAELLPD